jgi:hypothetical protein
VTVGFHSPLPPARTGVADYAAALLSRLRARGRIEVAGGQADVNLYHLGNNQLHAGIYRRAMAVPGVIVLHDAVLHHFFLGAFTAEEYIQEFVYNYGEWSRSLAETLWHDRARSAADYRYFNYPMLRRICETSRAVVVHNPAAAAMVRTHAPAARVIEIPMLFEPGPAPGAEAIEETRRSLQLGPRTLLFGIFGHLRESKRILPVIRVFRRLAPIDAVLLLAGDCGSRDLDRALQPFLSDASIRRIPYAAQDDFRKNAHATDVCINLRYPAAGETSAITISMMGIGKPVMVTDSPEVSRLPESACIRVPLGLSEESVVGEMMRWLIALPQDRHDIGMRARSHIAAHHNPERIADTYWQTLQAARS